MDIPKRELLQNSSKLVKSNFRLLFLISRLLFLRFSFLLILGDFDFWNLDFGGEHNAGIAAKIGVMEEDLARLSSDKSAEKSRNARKNKQKLSTKLVLHKSFEIFEFH